MPNDDTIRLLKECSAGTEMAVASINQVISSAKDARLHQVLVDYLTKHQVIYEEIHQKLQSFQSEDKSPNPIAKIMSRMKIRMNLLFNCSNKTIAKLMRKGCSMGIQSLKQYLAQYPTASSDIKKITERLITIERDFHDQLDPFV